MDARLSDSKSKVVRPEHSIRSWEAHSITQGRSFWFFFWLFCFWKSPIIGVRSLLNAIQLTSQWLHNRHSVHYPKRWGSRPDSPRADTVTALNNCKCPSSSAEFAPDKCWVNRWAASSHRASWIVHLNKVLTCAVFARRFPREYKSISLTSGERANVKRTKSVLHV